MKKVYVFLAEGFEEMEAVTPIDLLRRAGVDAKLVSVTGNRAVTGAHGVTYLADLLFEEISEDADMLVLPGGLPGTTNLQAHEGLTRLLLQQHEAHKWVAAICAAPTALAAFGVLSGKKATVYPGMDADLTAAGAAYTGLPLTIDGNIITGEALGAAIPFALAIARELAGADAAARPDTGSAPAARWHRGRSCRSHRWQPVRSPTKCADRLCRTAPSTPCGNRGQLLRFS